MNRAALLVAISLAACGDDGAKPTDAATDSSGDGTSAGPSQWVLGYYVGYDINAAPIASIQWGSLTHIAFAPLLVKTDQTLDFSFATGPFP